MTKKDEVNWNKVQKLLFKLVGSLVKQEVVYKKVQVQIKLPAEMVEIFEYISTKTGESLEQLISEYASSGITTQLQELIKESLADIGLEDKEVREDTIDLFKQMGLDTSELTETLDKLNNLAGTLDFTLGEKNGL
jgi:hypothetical protein